MPAPSGATARLQLPYPIPDDTVDVPRDIQALAAKLDPNTPTFSSGTTAARPAAGVAGRLYWDTTLAALFYDNGTAWMQASIPTVAALPTTPPTGFRVAWTPTVTGATRAVQWHMVYTGSAWSFQGGAPAATNPFPSWGFTGATLSALVAWVGGLTLTAPVAGTWLVEFGPAASRGSNSHNVSTQVDLGYVRSSVPGTLNNAVGVYFAAIAYAGNSSNLRDEANLSGGDVLTMTARQLLALSTIVLGTAGDIRLRLTPITI